MSDLSTRLSMPLIAPAQAQKHVTHNEALSVLDALVQSGVVAFDLAAPPSDAVAGALFVVADAPTGDWAGQAGNLAFLQNGGWVFLIPQDGWRAWDIATERLMVFSNAAWVPLQAEVGQLDGLGINSAWDPTNRLAVESDAALFTSSTGSHQLKVNKAADTDTASLLFQSAYTGHAEMGLAGDTSFAIKVSPDGSTWTEALKADSTTGALTTPSLILPSGDVQATLDELRNLIYGREDVTIVNGEITIGSARHIVITSETAGVADSLSRITGGYDGQIITCREGSGSGNISYLSDVSGGNIQTANNTSQTLTQARDSITFYRASTKWRMVALER